MLPASAFMLFRPTVAPARPCRVPREVREFMAPALELAVVPAAGGRQEEEEEKGDEGRGKKEADLLRFLLVKRNLTFQTEDATWTTFN